MCENLVVHLQLRGLKSCICSYVDIKSCIYSYMHVTWRAVFTATYVITRVLYGIASKLIHHTYTYFVHIVSPSYENKQRCWSPPEREHIHTISLSHVPSHDDNVNLQPEHYVPVKVRRALCQMSDDIFYFHENVNVYTIFLSHVPSHDDDVDKFYHYNKDYIY